MVCAEGTSEAFILPGHRAAHLLLQLGLLKGLQPAPSEPLPADEEALFKHRTGLLVTQVMLPAWFWTLGNEARAGTDGRTPRAVEGALLG